MCNKECIDFGIANLSKEEILGKRVLEVGALDVNGSLRASVEKLSPHTYVGVDISFGPGVDVICDASDIVDRFGTEAFDVVISSELLEHVRDWRKVVSNFKTVLKPGGVLLITTRSQGYGYHGYPFDFWRYEETDVKTIFSDLTILSVAKDSSVPGIFITAKKPVSFIEKDMSDIRLFSVIKNKRCHEVSEWDILLFRLKYPIVQTIQKIASRLLPATLKSKLRTLINKRKD